MHKNVKKKMQLMTHLTFQSRGGPEGTFDGAPKEAHSDLHKDAQKGACEITLKGAFEIGVVLCLWFYLLMQWLMHRCVHNGLSNGLLDATLEVALDGGLNIWFE